MDDDPGLRQAYVVADHELRLRLSKVGCYLCLFFVPLFWGLDLVVYPAHAWPMLEARLLCDLAVGIVLALLFTDIGRRNIRICGFLWAVAPAIAIAWMVAITEGAASPYYAGLNLVMIVLSLLMPWTAIEVLLICGLCLALYLLACLYHAGSFDLPWVDFVNNSYFMTTTAVICVTSGIFQARRRFKDFQLQHQLDERNQELDERNSELAALDRLKSQFYANISHELRTPLTLIIGPVEQLLDRTDLLPDQARGLHLIRQNCLRLLKLINDLLDVVRIENGQLQLNRTRVDIATWLPGIVDGCQSLATSKQLELVYDGPRDRVTTWIDTDRLEKVMLNLLTNACKFTEAGGRIRVDCRISDGSLQIGVHDNGIGIPAEELPHIFDRFHQVDGSATRQYQGLGIGLALAKELVEIHEGELRVESEAGTGTSFIIDMPLGSGAPSDTIRRSTDSSDDFARSLSTADRSGLSVDPVQAERPAAASEGDARPLVLIVDDEPDMRRYMASVIEHDHRICMAVDGESCLQEINAQTPDAILLDNMLPGRNGLDLLVDLRAIDRLRDCRIIMLTARTEDEVKLQALRSGADDFLTKPFSSQELRSRLNNLLSNAALQRSLSERNHELEETMRQLRSTEAQLVQSEKMNALGSLSAGLLHEINNPLNFAHTSLQLTLEDHPELSDELADVSGGMQRINEIVSGLRAFAHPEQGDTCEYCAVDELVDCALRFTAHEVKHCRIERDIPDGCTAYCAKTHVSQVLVNLLSNAGKATRTAAADTTTITISGRVVDERIEIRIGDNGPGIEPERLKRIFDPFYTSSEVGSGMGLGLAICHTIIERHGGHISATAEPGRGAEFRFDLPMHAAECHA